MLRVMSVFGTRPEAIKMAPVVLRLANTPGIEHITCLSGQHREMLQQVVELFDLPVQHNLDVMAPGQDLFDVTSKVMLGMRDVLRQEKPDVVLVHGDTTTTMAASTAAFYERIPVGHVEAGLRTWNLQAPWPEEFNRSVVGILGSYHFAPTERSRDNLLSLRVPPERIHVTGNTVIDALLMIRDRLDNTPAEDIRASFAVALQARPEFAQVLDSRLSGGDRRMLLVTGHRRENFGGGMERICKALTVLADRYPDLDIVYPVHLNPNVQRPVYGLLGERANIHLVPPLEYLPFVWLLTRATVVLTDSGGIQEEAPGLGKPVLVMRDTTERPEAIDAGTVELVGTDDARIVSSVSRLLDDPDAFAAMAQANNPYGDGHAAERIARILLDAPPERP